MFTSRLGLRLTIYALLIVTFFLGLPHIHYASALLIAILIRHKDEPKGIFGPVNSTQINLDLFKRGPKVIEEQALPKAPLKHPATTETAEDTQDYR